MTMGASIHKILKLRKSCRSSAATHKENVQRNLFYFLNSFLIYHTTLQQKITIDSRVTFTSRRKSKRFLHSGKQLSVDGELKSKEIDETVTKQQGLVKKTSRKSQKMFCKDPNKLLKNLFTTVHYDEFASIPNHRNTPDSLNETKELLVRLIDQELQRIQSSDVIKDVGVENYAKNKFDLKKLKLECIENIEEEMKLMKRLDKL